MDPVMELTPIAWSVERDKIVPAIVKAFAAMPVVAKNAKADLGKFKTSWADLAAILDAVRPILAANDLGLMQHPTMEGGLPRVTTTLLHASGQSCESTLTMKSTGSDAMSVGSAITYARRYAVVGILMLATEDDDDGREASKPAPKARVQAPPRQVSPRDSGTPVTTPPADPLTKRMFAMLNEAGIKTKDERLSYCSFTVGRDIESSKDLTRDDVSKIIDALSSTPPAASQDDDERPFD